MTNPFLWKLTLPHIPRFKVPQLPSFRIPRLKKRSLSDWIFWSCVASFLVGLIGIFFWITEPSLLGKNGLRVGADSSFYLYLAGMPTDMERVRTYGSIDPSDVPLFSFGMNIAGPVLIARLLHSNFLILCFDYLVFFLAFFYFRKAIGIRSKLLMVLLLVNPLTLESLMVLNKEVLALLGIALFAYYLFRKSKVALIAALAVSLFARWEQAAIILAFLLLLKSPFSRFKTVLLLLGTISVGYPLAALWVVKNMTSVREAGGNGIHLMHFFHSMQEHGLYFIAVWPKIAINLAGPLVNFTQWSSLDWYDLQNTSLTMISDVVMMWVLAVLIIERRFRLKSDFIYFALFYVLIAALSPFTEGRYLFPAYAFLCMELARHGAPKSTRLRRFFLLDSLKFSRTHYTPPSLSPPPLSEPQS